MRGQAENSFEVKGGVLYRVYKHPYVNGGKPLEQVMVPVQLRNRIMEVVHGSIIAATVMGMSPNKRFNEHVPYKSLYISVPFATKRQREMTKFYVF